MKTQETKYVSGTRLEVGEAKQLAFRMTTRNQEGRVVTNPNGEGEEIAVVEIYKKGRHAYTF